MQMKDYGDTTASTASLMSSEETKKKCSAARVCKLAFGLLCCGFMIVFVIFTVNQHRDINDLKRRVNRTVIGGQGHAHDMYEEHIFEDKTLQDRINSSSNELRANFALLKAHVKLLEMGNKTHNYNESFERINSDIKHISHALQNVTLDKKAFEIMVKQLRDVLNRAKIDLGRLEGDLRRLHANHSELDEARNAVETMVHNLTIQLNSHDSASGTTLRNLKTNLNKTRQRLSALVSQFTEQNGSIGLYIAQSERKVRAQLSAELDALRNSTLTSVNELHRIADEMRRDHKQAHGEFRYWNKSLDARLDKTIKPIKDLVDKLQTQIKGVETLQNSDKRHFSDQLSSQNQQFTRLKQEIQKLNAMAAGLTSSVSSNQNRAKQEETKVNSLINRMSNLETRVTKLENNGPHTEHRQLLQILAFCFTLLIWF